MNVHLACRSDLVLPAMHQEEIDKVRNLEALVLTAPQVETVTEHVFHAGMYARTICMEPRMVLTGALIKIATILVVSGDASVFIGDREIRIQGYQVIPASAGRKQAFISHGETHLTMFFTTSAQEVEEAENQFTDEADRLFSRRWPNVVVKTGEKS